MKRQSKSSQVVSAKKQKYTCKYKDEWTNEYGVIRKSNNKGIGFAFCTLCSNDFSVSHGGKNDIQRQEVELSQLRFAAMATMKNEDRSINDDDLEQLRKAALDSIPLKNTLNKLELEKNSNPHKYSNGNRRNYNNRHSNLIIIKTEDSKPPATVSVPVTISLSVTKSSSASPLSSNSSPTHVRSKASMAEQEQLFIWNETPAKIKTVVWQHSGFSVYKNDRARQTDNSQSIYLPAKFSRFESDSDTDDSSDDENDNISTSRSFNDLSESSDEKVIETDAVNSVSVVKNNLSEEFPDKKDISSKSDNSSGNRDCLKSSIVKDSNRTDKNHKHSRSIHHHSVRDQSSKRSLDSESYESKHSRHRSSHKHKSKRSEEKKRKHHKDDSKVHRSHKSSKNHNSTSKRHFEERKIEESVKHTSQVPVVNDDFHDDESDSDCEESRFKQSSSRRKPEVVISRFSELGQSKRLSPKIDEGLTPTYNRNSSYRNSSPTEKQSDKNRLNTKLSVHSVVKLVNDHKPSSNGDQHKILDFKLDSAEKWPSSMHYREKSSDHVNNRITVKRKVELEHHPSKRIRSIHDRLGVPKAKPIYEVFPRKIEMKRHPKILNAASLNEKGKVEWNHTVIVIASVISLLKFIFSGHAKFFT
ncbi:hypothetical protein GQR58_012671 [Nymphon striatum]|nr:hypothetical protein GQR58_012671 [Nymphon striatum]